MSSTNRRPRFRTAPPISKTPQPPKPKTHQPLASKPFNPNPRPSPRSTPMRQPCARLLLKRESIATTPTSRPVSNSPIRRPAGTKPTGRAARDTVTGPNGHTAHHPQKQIPTNQSPRPGGTAELETGITSRAKSSHNPLTNDSTSRPKSARCHPAKNQASRATSPPTSPRNLGIHPIPSTQSRPSKTESPHGTNNAFPPSCNPFPGGTPKSQRLK